MRFSSIAIASLVLSVLGCAIQSVPLGRQLTQAVTIDGEYIHWREHIIDDAALAGFNLNGSDGLVVGDLDGDGFDDVVSVHEYDAGYDSSVYDADFEAPADGHVRIAFGSSDPQVWFNVTLAQGLEAPAPEDAALADVNGDGFLDVMVATELSHLIYLQNPGSDVRNPAAWPRLILPMTQNRGSYIRVFLSDLDGDGQPEAVAPNKGAQRPGPEHFASKQPVSIFKVIGDPLAADGWQEQVLGEFSVPQNAEPVDMDGDGDFDVIVGSRGEGRLVLFENTGGLNFTPRAVTIQGGDMSGFNMDYADLNGDGRLDIIADSQAGWSWIAQPKDLTQPWQLHTIGAFPPDRRIGLITADIDGDGDLDLMTGSYSKGDRQDESNIQLSDPAGRLAWFENPGVQKLHLGWQRHDISRRKRGMFDKFIARDVNGDGYVDFLSTRGNSYPYDGVFWLEQVRSTQPAPAFTPARLVDSEEISLPGSVPE